MDMIFSQHLVNLRNYCNGLKQTYLRSIFAQPTFNMQYLLSHRAQSV